MLHCEEIKPHVYGFTINAGRRMSAPPHEPDSTTILEHIHACPTCTTAAEQARKARDRMIASGLLSGEKFI